MGANNKQHIPVLTLFSLCLVLSATPVHIHVLASLSVRVRRHPLAAHQIIRSEYFKDAKNKQNIPILALLPLSYPRCRVHWLGTEGKIVTIKVFFVVIVLSLRTSYLPKTMTAVILKGFSTVEFNVLFEYLFLHM